MGQMKTPGVYVVEKSAFPNSVVEVATAVPAFIGYTEKAVNGGKSLANKPWRITSMAEFINYFGGAPDPVFSIAEKADAEPAEAAEEGKPAKKKKEDLSSAEEEFIAAFTFAGKEYSLDIASGDKMLFYSMQMFFQNGGGPCYVVSVGDYVADIEADRLKAGIKTLVKEQEPTMLVIPEAMKLAEDDCISVQQEMLAHCGGLMRNRVALLDVYNGYLDRQDPSGDVIDNFRNKLGINYLDFAVAYYPWVNTSIVQDSALSYNSIANKDVLQTLLKSELGVPEELPAEASPKEIQLSEALGDIVKEDLTPDQAIALNKTLIQVSPLYNLILKEIKDKLNLLPPTAAMAGVYTMVDNSRGVWKAPANVSLASVIAPAVNITHAEQEDLNVTLQGKSVNAIRSFVGEGTLVWGARTLDGNSQDWRYVNVRRTMIMLEESIKIASKAYVFEPNVANTWVSIKAMISNFLTGIWKRGGLAGAVPTDAFSVHVGLGETMTANDILDGIMRITVLVAISRPAEFIEITFQQQMQKS